MHNPFGYDGKRIVLTGGATGVGAALLEVLAELGVGHTTVLDIRSPDGPHDAFLATDLSQRDAVDEAIAAIDGPVDVLFNNAGVADTQAPETVFAVNYLALRHLTDGLGDAIPRGGAIVNTASIAGSQWAENLPRILELLGISEWADAAGWFTEQSELTTPPYFFTKQCVQVFTMWAARDAIARGVRINSVCPAPIDTPLLDDFRKTMTDTVIDWTIDQSMGRPVTAREVALAMAFLGSEAASYVSGVNLVIDAGFTGAMATGQVDFSALS